MPGITSAPWLSPSPGDQRQVLDLVALLEPSPFDPSMSPWDVTIIEGLEGGRAALYLRAHHSLTDGSHGVSIVRLFLDERTPAARHWFTLNRRSRSDGTAPVSRSRERQHRRPVAERVRDASPAR